MGTWGAGIFSDDTAADIKGDWREAILDGLSPEDATQRLLALYEETRSDPDEASVFWIALAAAQFETGRLLPDVRDRALDVIAQGADIARFAESSAKFAHERQRVLDRLATSLKGPQRPPTRLRPPTLVRSPIAIGDVVRIRGSTGRRDGLLVVVGETESYPPGSTMPVMAALLWTGGDVPSIDALSRLPLVLDDGPPLHKVKVSLYAVHSPPSGRLSLSNHGSVVARNLRHPDAPDDAVLSRKPDPFGYTSWQYLADWVESDWFEHCVALTSRAQRGVASRLVRWRQPR